MSSQLEKLRDEGNLSPGVPQRNEEAYQAGKAFREDHAAYQNPAGAILSAYKAERAVQSTHGAYRTNPADRFVDLNRQFRATCEALGAPHSRRYKTVMAVVCNDQAPSNAGAITTKHRGVAGQLALGDVRTALTDLLHHYRATGRLNREPG